MKYSLLLCLLVAAQLCPAFADPQTSSPDVGKTEWKIVNPVDAPHREPIRMGGPLEPIYKVDPAYPSDAKESRVSGVVVLRVVVNEKGEVYEAQVIRGHPLLNRSALDAVRQWRYKVSIVAGKPIPVLATVTVTFNLRDERKAHSPNSHETLGLYRK